MRSAGETRDTETALRSISEDRRKAQQELEQLRQRLSDAQRDVERADRVGGRGYQRVPMLVACMCCCVCVYVYVTGVRACVSVCASDAHVLGHLC